LPTTCSGPLPSCGKFAPIKIQTDKGVKHENKSSFYVSRSRVRDRSDRNNYG
jgi:hypothetical protein